MKPQIRHTHFFHCLGPHITEQAHCLIKELYIVSILKFKRDVSLYPVILAETDSLVMYYRSVGIHLGHDNYIYTKLFKCAKKKK